MPLEPDAPAEDEETFATTSPEFDSLETLPLKSDEMTLEPDAPTEDEETFATTSPEFDELSFLTPPPSPKDQWTPPTQPPSPKDEQVPVDFSDSPYDAAPVLPNSSKPSGMYDESFPNVNEEEVATTTMPEAQKGEESITIKDSKDELPEEELGP